MRVEVKAAGAVSARDTAGLRHLADRLGDHFVRGVVLYNGTSVVPFAATIHAGPLSALWRAPLSRSTLQPSSRA